jgi:hypothetical protein
MTVPPYPCLPYRRYAFLAKPAGSALTEEALKPTAACADGTAAGNPAYLKTIFDGWCVLFCSSLGTSMQYCQFYVLLCLCSVRVFHFSC